MSARFLSQEVRHYPAPVPARYTGAPGIRMLEYRSGPRSVTACRVPGAPRCHAGLEPQRGEDLQSQLRQVSP